MIIKKKPVKACDTLIPESAEIEECTPDIILGEPVCSTAVAQDYIKAAIDELCKIAKDNNIVKESIANLSVVLLDLKTNC